MLQNQPDPITVATVLNEYRKITHSYAVIFVTKSNTTSALNYLNPMHNTYLKVKLLGLATAA